MVRYAILNDHSTGALYSPDLSEVILCNKLPSCNQAFIGRKDEIKAIASHLSNQSVLFITGMAGIGKSEVAKAYAQTNRKKYTNIIYLYYTGDLRKDIANLTFADDSVEMNEEVRFQNHYKVMQRLHTDTLLILDNFNVLPKDEPFLKELMKNDMQLLITSRCKLKNYDSIEIKELDKEKELTKLDLDKRKAELALKQMESQSEDGMVYAEFNGTVKKAGDPDNLPNDGSAFLTLSGSDGLYVKGTLNELALEQVKVGQSVTATSWSTGMVFDATITEINDYPEDSNGYYYGNGNPNASYYGYTAYIEDSTGLSNGDNLSLSINLGGDEDSSDKIYLDKAYVRKEDGKSYVMKDDGTGHLVKQYVKTGKTIYGYAVEIKSGVTMDDYLAFPYGKTAKEGVKTNKDEDSGTVMY